MGWFQKKTYPDFWESYLTSFDKKPSNALDDTRFVVFDTETTGLNIEKDRILSIGAIVIHGMKIKVSESFERYIHQETFNTETVKIHGLLKEGNSKKVDETTAVKEFTGYIQNAVLIAHHADFDIAMINKGLRRMGLPKLKNKVIDTVDIYNSTLKTTAKKHIGLDELATQLHITQHDRHTASGDAYITALAFLKLVAHLKHRNPQLNLNDLCTGNSRKSLL